MKEKELALYEVKPSSNLWTSLPLMMDGYQIMHMAESHYHYKTLGGWGRSGYELGSWPFVIFFSRPLGGDDYEVVKYVERDVTLYRCTHKAVYHALMDLLAFLEWKRTHQEWVEPYSSVEELPPELRGPIGGREEDTHVVLRWSEETQHLFLVAGPTSEEKAQNKVRDLLSVSGMVTFVEPVRDVILPTDDSGIVHVQLSFFQGRKG